MKDSYKLTVIFLLVAVYSFGISLWTGSYVAPGYSQTGNTHDEGYWSAVSNNLFFYFSESEKLVSDVRTNAPINYKTSFTSFFAFVQTSGQLLQTGFSLYRRVSANFLIRYRKADIIFPFHYFW